MISYNKKAHIKLFLFIGASILGLSTIFLINKLVTRVEKEEKEKVILWAQAIQRKSHLVEYTKRLFEKLQEDERRKAEIWSAAMQQLSDENAEGDLTFLVKIISSNKNIPSILTDKYNIVTSTINTDIDIPLGKPLDANIKKQYSNYDPIPVIYKGDTLSILYYNDSRLFVELQNVLNNYIRNFISEVVSNSASMPVIITDHSKKQIIGCGNIDSLTLFTPQLIYNKIADMESDNNFIEINNGDNYIFYEESYLLRSLKYYPLLFLVIIIIYIGISYLAFTSSRRFEQNQVWVGMSKETAHQLGTPISSLMAWVEVLKLKDIDSDIIEEINKDTVRLNTIADRFSKIGSEPVLKKTDLTIAVQSAINYLETRVPKSITFIQEYLDIERFAYLNNALFEWVIENVCKNAIDAIEKQGSITIIINETSKFYNIDISDTGKGIPRSKHKTIFKPGFTTKTRGWGLGLTLAKRIIEEYHKGRIFVKNSEINKGTTFRIAIPKA